MYTFQYNLKKFERRFKIYVPKMWKVKEEG